MAAPAKFLFDMDFSAPDKTRERPATPAELAQKMAAAEARGYRDGFDAGQREAKAESDRRAALALEEIGIGIEAIARRFSGIETRMETEAVDVAVAVARKLCSELIAAEPLGAITGLVSDCFSHLVSTPHLVVRINETLYEAARAPLPPLVRGHVIVVVLGSVTYSNRAVERGGARYCSASPTARSAGPVSW